MKQVRIHDAELLHQLQSNAAVDVVDATGRVIGRVEFKAMTYPEIGLTDEELQNRLHDPNAKWFTADEVVTRLKGHMGGAR